MLIIYLQLPSFINVTTIIAKYLKKYGTLSNMGSSKFYIALVLKI